MADKTLTPPTTTYDPNSASNLNTSLQNQFQGSDQYQSIMNRYASAQQATAANTQQTNQYLSSVAGGNIDYEKLQGGIQQQTNLEERRGFATNVAALTNIQRQTDQRVKQLTDQAQQALMANNAQGAQALSQLAVQEQESLTNARTQFLNQYFATQQEARAQASFRTPEQTAAIALAQQYPDAGISEGDTLQTAQAKIMASPVYKNNIAKVQQDIATAQAQAGLAGAQALAVPLQTKAALMQAGAAQTSAGAQANLAGAQAAQTRFLTGLYQGTGGSNSSDVQALLNGSLTPQTLQAKYANIPNGGLIASQVLNQAQAQGYNLNSGTLTGLAQQRQTETLNSGNLLGTVGLGLTNLFNTGSKTLYNSTNVGGTGNTVQYQGKTYTFPSASAAAGFKQQMGIQ